MASLGGSMKKGQTAMACQLCENDPKMKWKCVDCSLMMCQRCREKVHPKFPGSADHTILDLKEISTVAQPDTPKLDFSKIPCESHAGQNACLFCTKCDKLVCPSCVSQTHNRHDLIEINQAYNTKLKEIKNIQAKLDSKLNIHNAGSFVIEDMKQNEREKFEGVRQQILDYKQKLVEAFNKANTESDDLLSQLDQKWSEFIVFIGKESRKHINIKASIKDQRKALDDLSISNDVKGVFSAASNASSMTEENVTSINTNAKQIPKLAVPDVQIPLPKFEQCYIPYQLSLFTESQWDVDSISEEIINLIVLENDTFLINNSYNDVQFLGIDDTKLEKILTYKTKVLDIARNKQGDILIADGSDSLKMIQSGSGHVIESSFSFSQLNAVAVHVRSDGYIVAGVVEPGSTYGTKGVGKIIVMDPRGNTTKTFGSDKSREPLLSVPNKLATNQDHDIGIIDRFSDDYCGRFILLDKNGKVKTIYTGCQSINKDDPFKPSDIICTPSNNFVISEYWHHQLIIFNNKGDLVAYHSTPMAGIASPTALGMIDPAQIYLGCRATSYSDNKARIYKLRRFPW